MSARSASAPRAQLIITGDELLRGFIQDANSGFIASELRAKSIELADIRIVGDDLATIEDALSTAASRSDIDIVIVTGGLGPTHDDRTSEAVANVAQRPLKLNEAALEIVEARVRAFGRMRTPEEHATFTPGNRKQATLPDGAVMLEPLGTAPGYVLDVESTCFVVLPGPPSELRAAWAHAWDTDALTRIAERVTRGHERLVRLWGIPESRASEVLTQLDHTDTPACHVTLCARDGELEFSIRGSDAARVDSLVQGLSDAFPDAVFAVDDERSIAEIVGHALKAEGLTLGLAESCTGGMLGAAVTSVPGSAEWMRGGIVSYNNDIKASALGVPADLITAHGAVSEEVAHAMAAGARVALGVDIGVAITGIAGPGGGSEQKPVGTVHIAVHGPEGEPSHARVYIPGDRATVRRRTCTIALHRVRLVLRAMSQD